MCIEDDHPFDDDYSPVCIAPLRPEDSGDIQYQIDLELLLLQDKGLLLHNDEVSVNYENKNEIEDNDFTIIPLSNGVMANSFLLMHPLYSLPS